MLHIALYQPEIPPNTGNIIRLAANTGAILHLIKPLGFSLDEKQVRRAGLDYYEVDRVRVYESWEAFQVEGPKGRRFAISTKGTTDHCAAQFEEGDVLLFGPETRGLPKEIREALPAEQVLRIPMRAQSRSLNLSNSVAIVLYEALRQLGFDFEG